MGTTRQLLVAAGVTAAATLAVDQVSKRLVRDHLAIGEDHPLTAGGGIGLRHVENRGISYGLLGGVSPWVPAVATAAIGGTLLALGRGSSRPVLAGIGVGLVVGGGVGNVVDRVHHGAVTDFLHAGSAFGSFNVADVAINVGMAAAGAAILLRAR